MSAQIINIGSYYNDPTADTIPAAFAKCNTNFANLLPAGTTVTGFSFTIGPVSSRPASIATGIFGMHINTDSGWLDIWVPGTGWVSAIGGSP